MSRRDGKKVAHIYTLDGARVEAIPPGFALYPYGAFTSFVAADGAVLGWQQHLERLAAGARELWGHELDPQRLRDAVRSHFAIQGGSPASVRITIFPDTFSLAAPDEAEGCSFLVSSGPADLPFAPRESFAVQSVQHTRRLAHLKSTDLFTQIGLRRAARIAGYDDALLLNGDSVLEGATWSILVWKDGRVVTPESNVLASVTVAQLEQVATALHWNFEFGSLTRSDLRGADLVLGVNVNNPARAVSQIDGVGLAVDGSLLGSIAATFNDLRPETV
ncbi:hypothetical protein C6I20_07735 [Aeromicrobium sp. A1-2]|uniref:aminotransferase class IV n=1 Tax=Aeromicrobium sp. A1-2 TaxID=2107713 RepID=UPI000E4F627E|nr:aminotransferase class IV [Aeromicrobium sp. A1-2]AXT85085.1 hypothetical protein C6I20_07735 [Aeromicrobium sp. A1-2]